MDHIAIMNKSWKLIAKILRCEKTIESRWYKHKIAPWGRISCGDMIYFKDAGEPVTARARVLKVLQFEQYNENTLREMIDEYYDEVRFVSSKEEVFQWALNKKHCILIFLADAVDITPFNIDKKGFGNACAWMCVGDIDKVKNRD